MLDLKLFGDSGAMARVAARLDALAGTAQVRVVEATRPGKAVVRADVAHDSVDDVLDELERLAVPASDVSLARVELVGRLAGRRADTRFAWADVLGVAGTNARVVGQYLVFMAVAGVIGCYGRHRSQSAAARRRDGGEPDLADHGDRRRRDRPRPEARPAGRS